MSQRGLGRIYRRGAGGWFWLQVSYQGRQYRKPAKTQDENEARTALGKWLAEVSAGMFVPEARAVMFGDLERLALENYAAEQRKSAHTLKNCLCNLREVFGSMRALDITTPRLAAYVARRRKEHAAASTIKKELNAMSLALRCAREAYGGAFVHRPEFPRVSIPKSARRRGFFEPEQLERVLAHLPDVYVPVIRFLAATGWRFGEAVGLEWRNVDERAGIIRIEDTKSDEPRTLPYAANALLVGLIRSRREATRTIERRTRRLVRHVFANAEGHSLRTGFHDAWEKARKAAGLPSALIHDLRRTFARDCVRAGLAEATIMKLAGWETASVFRRYAIVNESDLAEATRRLAASRGVRVPDVYPNSGDDGEQAGQAVAVSGCNAPLASDTEDTAVHVNAFEVPGDHQIPFVPAPSQPPVVAQGSTEQPSAAETPGLQRVAKRVAEGCRRKKPSSGATLWAAHRRPHEQYAPHPHAGGPSMGGPARRIGLGMLLIPPGLVPVMQTPALAQAPTYITQWGGEGSGSGQFIGPYGVAVDASGYVFVVDAGNNRIQKFTSGGSFVTQWGGFWQAPLPGNGAGLFCSPRAVAVDACGHVYVADTSNGRIQKFTGDGTYLTQWGAVGFGDGEFDWPQGVAVSASGDVYVADAPNNPRIQRFTSDGAFISKWGTPGSGNGQFSEPLGVHVDANNNVYVSDWDAMRIQKFTTDGTYLAQWGSYGSGNGQFLGPWGLATDAQGNVYVADAANCRIQVFTGAGAYIAQWGTPGSGNGQFVTPTGVAVDGSGNVYVADRDNNRIQKFGHLPTPTKSTTWGRLKRLYR